MRLLAIETATEACSVALFVDGSPVGAFHETIGRGHAERLVPLIAALPDRGRADRIWVSLGPGSFTGVRIGLAAARALGIAWNVPVCGFPTLALVAAMVHAKASGPVTICMNAGHGQWFVQDFGSDGLPLDALQSLTPEEAARRGAQSAIAGSRAADLAGRLGRDGSNVWELLPDAAHSAALPCSLLTDVLTPLYGRPPDAKAPVR